MGWVSCRRGPSHEGLRLRFNGKPGSIATMGTKIKRFVLPEDPALGSQEGRARKHLRELIEEGLHSGATRALTPAVRSELRTRALLRRGRRRCAG